MISGMLIVVFSISSAALVFSGGIAGHINQGIGIALFGAAVTNIIIALTSSYQGSVSSPQSANAAILALVTAGVAAAMPGAGHGQVMVTIMLAIALATFLNGALFLGLGALKLANFVRFIPYPVIGGFSAGAGWLMTKGAVGVICSVPFTMADLPLLAQPGAAMKLFSGVFFAFLILFFMRRVNHFLVLPLMLLWGMVFFYVAMFAIGGSVESAKANGWLLGPFPAGSLWEPMSLDDLAGADFLAIAYSLPHVGSLLIISLISFLLNASSVEVLIKRDLDLNDELKYAGIANLAASAGGGMAGFHSLSVAALNNRMNAESRAVGLIVAAICLVAMFLGASALSYMPKPVIGGFLLYGGVDFLITWIVLARSKLPKADYLVVMLILVVIASIGFIEGIIAGILSGIILFVEKYSQVNVVKNELTGENFHSNVERSFRMTEALKKNGARLYILKLQGFIFFGTANNLLSRVRDKIEKAGPAAQLGYVLFDFRLVHGLDSSATMSFTRLNQLAESKTIRIVMVSVAQNILRQFDQAGITYNDGGTFYVYSDLDRDLEWCENQVLSEMKQVAGHDDDSMLQRMRREMFGDDDWKIFEKYLEKVSVEGGHKLIRQGDPSDSLYFVEAGEVTILLELSDGKTIRIRTMGAGTVVGEVGMYMKNKRTATIIAETKSVLCRITSESIERMTKEHSAIAMRFHNFMARTLAERLSDTNKMFTALLD